MALEKTLDLQYMYDDVIKDNKEYLELYHEVSVPRREKRRITSLLYERGRTKLGVFIRQLSKNTQDIYLQRRYVYALMESGDIKFNTFLPLGADIDVWVQSL